MVLAPRNSPRACRSHAPSFALPAPSVKPSVRRRIALSWETRLRILPGNARSYVAVAACLLVLACRATVCPAPGGPPAVAPHLSPGTYQLTLHADSGSRTGATAIGVLQLVASTPDDQSPITGQKPWLEWEAWHPLYGWLEMDLASVGAPVFAEDWKVPPTSRDPITPGVLVDVDVRSEGYPVGTPVLLVGTAGQTRNPATKLPDGSEVVTVAYDGAGIGLWVHRANSAGFAGVWREWGIVANGRGTFCAQLVPEQAASAK